MIHRRPLQALLGIAALATLAASPLHAAGRIIAFGDSITYGVGDDPARTDPGYTPRLEALLLENDLVVDVVNDGKGGEDTVQGLSRIDPLLTEGDAMLLLMEGTNDISREISTETTLFNLDAMAKKAEAKKIHVVHATVIPRAPFAHVDPTNTINKAFNEGIRKLAADSDRALVDNYAAFWALPHLFDDYYYEGQDPVGHPNDKGYDVMAATFAPVVAEHYPIIDLTIVPPETIVVGEMARFGAEVEGEVATVEWHFGDEGLAWSDRGGNFVARWLFTEPGEYAVTAIARDRLGRAKETSTVVTVEPGTVTTKDEVSYIEWVTASSAAGGATSTCTWSNVAAKPALLELTFLLRGVPVGPASERQIFLDPGFPVRIDDVLPTLFGVTDTAGALRMKTRAIFGAPAVHAWCAQRTTVDGPAGGVYGQIALGEQAAAGSPEPKVLAGLVEGGGQIAVVRVANVSLIDGVVTAEVFDAHGDRVGSPAPIAVSAGTARQRRLVDLARLAGTTGPWSVRLTGNGIPFLASASETDSQTGDTALLGAPAGGGTRLYLPRVARGGGWFKVYETTDLFLHSESSGPTTLEITLLPRGSASNLRKVAVELGPGETRRIADVVHSLFGLDTVVGGVAVDWTNDDGVPPQVHAMTSGTLRKWRYLMSVDPVDADGLIAKRGEAFGAEQTASERTNVGLVNPGGGRVSVLFTLRTKEGVELGTTRVSVARAGAYERALSALFPNLPRGGDWVLRADVLSGGPVLSYLLRSNVTGDAFLIPLRETP